jgi:hypothetical protein
MFKLYAFDGQGYVFIEHVAAQSEFAADSCAFASIARLHISSGGFHRSPFSCAV